MKIQHALFVAAACLVTSLASHAQVPQREKMKACNAEAKAGVMKGAERKAFMKSCLSTKKAEGAAKAAAKPAKP